MMISLKLFSSINLCRDNRAHNPLGSLIMPFTAAIVLTVVTSGCSRQPLHAENAPSGPEQPAEPVTPEIPEVEATPSVTESLSEESDLNETDSVFFPLSEEEQSAESPSTGDESSGSSTSVTATEPVSAPLPPMPEATEDGSGTYRIPRVEPLPEQIISLEEALAAALSNNLDLQVKRIDRRLASDVIRQARGAFNPVLSLDAEFEDIRNPQNTQEFVQTGGNQLLLAAGEPRVFKEENWRYKVALEGKLPTGTQYELFTQYDVLSNTLNETSALSLFAPEFGSFTGITLTQPLLRGFGTDVNLAEIRVARKNKIISELEVRASMLETVGETLRAYFDLAYMVENLEFKRSERDLAEQIIAEKREQLEKGQVSAREVNRSESALAELIEDLTLARNEVIQQHTRLQSLISGSTPQAEPFVFRPDSGLPIPDFKVDMNQLLAEAAAHRPQFLIARQAVEREGIRLVYAANQIWPQIDLKGTYGRNGLAGNYGRSYRKGLLDNQGDQWSVGFQVSFPLWNDEAIGQKQEAENQKEQSILRLKQVEINTSLMVQQLMAIIESNYQRLEAMRLFKSNASRAYGDEELRLEKGLSTELDLLRFKRDLNQAKVREMAALADLNKAYVKLFETTGTLLDRYNIQLHSTL